MKNIKFLYKKELLSYFNTPSGYIFMSITLFFNFLFFFLGIFDLIPGFWDAQLASIESYMNLLPFTFIFLVPAVTMRVWAEERKMGTIEILKTLPYTDFELVISKFLASWTFVSLVIIAAFPLTISISLLGITDWGKTFTIYFGSILMAGAYVSIGMVASALTREQIVAFVLTFFISLFMFLSNYYLLTQHLPPDWNFFLGIFSISYHFSSFSKGMILISDVIYYLSFIALMLYINTEIVKRF
ncbi:MAG: ABC transporter permease [Leptospiraceae bacterium]|nr:ABC transporter permease [Leptospiraceae bacterium]MDW7975615.1 ABC transporter permease [Leptospiraceae bacterium]